MAHEDAGHYAAKHPTGTELNSRIAEQLTAHAVDGRISCAVAHKIAEALQVSPQEVGVAIDLLEIRINLCQLDCLVTARRGKLWFRRKRSHRNYNRRLKRLWMKKDCRVLPPGNSPTSLL